jgi:hypothetical protein
MGFEDVATLSILLPLGIKLEEIPRRLAAVEELRKERAEAVASLSKGPPFCETDADFVPRRWYNSFRRFYWLTTSLQLQRRIICL